MDIETFWDIAGFRGDWRLAPDGQMASDSDLKTAVMISLFTWRRAHADDALPDPAGGRKGWWGDAISDRPIGSRLWLLHREKQLKTVVQRAREYAEEALAWLVEDGVCMSVEVNAEISAPGVLGLQCAFWRNSASKVQFRFDFAWSNLQLVKA